MVAKRNLPFIMVLAMAVLILAPAHPAAQSSQAKGRAPASQPAKDASARPGAGPTVRPAAALAPERIAAPPLDAQDAKAAPAARDDPRGVEEQRDLPEAAK